jgi:iron complex outermembrane receptor protein
MPAARVLPSLLGLAVASLALPALAAEEGEDLYFSNIPVVLTVSRLAQSQADAPGSVTVIDRELIRASGAREVSDLLRLVPGFQVTPPNQDAARVTYHGLSDEFPSRLQVLIDGRSQYSPLYFGGVNWNLLPVGLEDIERIEVIRGSNSAAYGANAFLGVVNIITIDPSQTRGALVKVARGNASLRDNMARVGQGDEHFNYRLSVRSNSDQGITNLLDDRLAQQFDFRADWQATERDSVRLSTGQVRSTVQNGSASNRCNPLRPFEQRSSYLQTDWQHTLSATEDVQLRYYRQQEWGSDRHDELCDGLTFDVNYGGRSQRDDLELQHTFAPWQDARLVWGAGVRGDSVAARFYFGTDQPLKRNIERLFGSLEWRLAPAWLLNVGGTWEHDSDSGGNFAPRVSLNHRLLPDHTLRLTASRAFRSPSIIESRSRWDWNSTDGSYTDRQQIASPGLKAEKIDSLEFGYIGEVKPLHLNIDTRVFHERIPNRIETVPVALQPGQCENVGDGLCGTADQAVNGEQVSIRGAEYQLRWQPLPGSRLVFNQAYVHMGSQLLDVPIYDTPFNIAKISRQTLASAPRRNSSLMWMQQLPGGFDFSLMWYQLTGLRWTQNTIIDKYARVDWRLAYPFRVAGKSGEAAWTVQSANGDHNEFRPSQVVTQRHWFSLRFEL